MRIRLGLIGFAAAVCAGIAITVGCSDSPTDSLSPNALDDTLADLRNATSSYQTLEGAAAAGYVTNIGCLDERLDGVDAAQARGMGYHLGKGADGLALVDNTVDLYTPDFLVYAPAENDADFPPEERLAHARLVALDYFVPGTADDNPPAPLLGQDWTFSSPLGGWIRHIYLWGTNPDGIFSDWNADIPLCS